MLELVRPADERVEQTAPGPVREVEAVRVQRIPRRGRALRAFTRGRPGGGVLRSGDLRDAVGDEVEHVEPGDALRLERPSRV